MKKEIKKIAIANRGEIAVRLISTFQEMGIHPILLYSAQDQNSLAYRMSPEKVCIGPANISQSYLNINSCIEGALSLGADAIHPGYGFLSENPGLAKTCEENNIIFIGPSPKCLEIFGDKVRARELAINCGLPVLPAYTGSTSNQELLLKEVCKMGFPVMIKSTGGGGGRGLRIVHSKEEWKEAFLSAKRETKNAFGSENLFIEKYLADARHIEVQVFGDASGQVFHLLDRDCSVQRKHQKIIEEAPARLPLVVRQEMSLAAVELLKSVDYLYAGTVEFLYQDGKFYFMEVNPRIQVECPVTEMILGIDLIRAQVLTAQGFMPFSQKSFEQKSFVPRGHSIQCRIYAEDMEKQVPSLGKLGTCLFPQGVNRRFDIGYESYDEVSEFYDSMLGKLIVWDENRSKAIEKMNHALKETVIFGLKSNIPFLQDLINHETFIKGRVTTQFVENTFLKHWKGHDITKIDPWIISSIQRFFSGKDINKPENKTNNFNPWTYFR